jgi:quercetin dioxygenase-like cupin family protein
LEVIRLVVRAGEELPERKAKGIVVISCLEGRVMLTALDRTQTLQAGQLLYLPPGEAYTLRGAVDSSLLLTTLLPAPAGK